VEEAQLGSVLVGITSPKRNIKRSLKSWNETAKSRMRIDECWRETERNEGA